MFGWLAAGLVLGLILYAVILARILRERRRLAEIEAERVLRILTRPSFMSKLIS